MVRLPLSSVVLMIIGMSLIPAGDTAGKLLSGIHDVAPAFIGWSRFLLGALMVMAVLRILPAPQLYRDWRVWLRGGLIAGGIMCILTALRTEDIANVFGAFFVGPALSYILAVLLLGESFSRARAGLVALGFLGVVMVVQPGADMSPGILFAVLAGCFYGAFLTASRWLSSVASARQLLLSQLLIGALFLTPLGVMHVPPLTGPVAGLTLVSAACSALGNLLLVIAYARSHATVLAPLVYTQLVAATGLGVVVFGTLPNALALAGLAVLIASGAATMFIRR